MAVFRCASCGSMNRIPDPSPPGTPRCGRCKNELSMTGEPQAVDEAGFDETIRTSPVPVLVDFWAEWCGPCRMAAPILDTYARSQAGKLVVLKVDTDEQQRLAGRYRVSSIPTFLVFSGGNVVGQQIGMLPRGAFDTWVASVTGG